MEYTRFEEFWNLNPEGRKEDVLVNYQAAIYTHGVSHGVTEEVLISKMREYLNMCKKQNRKAQYIQSPENWLAQEKYLQDFHKADGSTRNFIERWLENLP